MGRDSLYFSKYCFLHDYCTFTDLNSKIRDILIFFAGVERLKITFQYVGYQSWGRLHANVIDSNYNYFEIS